MEEHNTYSFSNNIPALCIALREANKTKPEAEEIKDLLGIIRHIGKESLNKGNKSFQNFIYFKRRMPSAYFTVQFYLS